MVLMKNNSITFGFAAMYTTSNIGYVNFDPDSMAASPLIVTRINDLTNHTIIASVQGSDFIAYSTVSSTLANKILCF
jgi:hypothetical protein